ncbi:MAG: hypothetical protein ACFFAN_06525 [Promethearchaeota archaeon]
MKVQQIRISPQAYEFLQDDIEKAKKLNLDVAKIIFDYVFNSNSKENIILKFSDLNDNFCEVISTENCKKVNINQDLILPFHPLPKNEKSIGEWIDSLAKANSISFKSMFFYILKLSIKNSFEETLKDLTGISEEDISKLHNDFNYKFLNNKYHCPICNQRSNSRDYIFIHINLVHNLGCENIKHPYYEFLAKNKPQLQLHIKRKHCIVYLLKKKI